MRGVLKKGAAIGKRKSVFYSIALVLNRIVVDLHTATVRDTRIYCKRPDLSLPGIFIPALCLSACMGLMPEQISAEERILIGTVSVIDGDTLDLHGQRIRLHGIDAPESGQSCADASGQRYRCGQRAALALSDRIGGRPVTCDQRDRDRYGRVIGVCLVGRTDLNAWMVETGHAVAYRRYSPDYVRAEAAARAAGRGLWAGAFVMPWDWRRGERL